MGAYRGWKGARVLVEVADKATFSSSAADAAEKVVEEAVWVLK